MVTRIVTQDEFETQRSLARKKPEAKEYPYAEWFDGNPRVFTRDEDFENKTLVFISMLRYAANKYGKVLHVTMIDKDSFMAYASKR